MIIIFLVFIKKVQQIVNLAKRVNSELKSYRNIAREIGSISDLSDENVTDEEKQIILNTRMEQYELQSIKIISDEGLDIFDGFDSSAEDYFKEAMNGNTYVDDPLINKADGSYKVIISAPLWKDGIPGTEAVGAVYIVPEKNFLNDLVGSIAVGQSDSAYILDRNGNTIAYADQEILGENSQELAKTDASFAELAVVEKNQTSMQVSYGSEGFAVVAEEVRNLASKSSASAKDTTLLIEDSLKAVNDGIKIAGETEDALRVLADNSESFLKAIDEIMKATEDQALSIEQVTTGIEQISSVVQSNSATAEESAAASQELSEQSKNLKKLVGKYTLKSFNTTA